MENSPVTGRKHYNGGANYRYDSPDSPSSPISPYSPDSPGKPGFTRHERPVSYALPTLNKNSVLETAYYYTRRRHRDYDF